MPYTSSTGAVYDDADYAAEILFDLAQVSPHVAGPDTVGVMRSVAEFTKEQKPVHKAYLLSCVNSRLNDLAQAADVLRGKKLADGVELYMAAASETVQTAAEARGIWQDLVAAGAIPLPPGCGACIGCGPGVSESADQVTVSAINRNYRGRSGPGNLYLASPLTVAASAVEGRIVAFEPGMFD